MSKVYMIYDTKNDDIPIAQYEFARDIAKYFSMTVGSIYSEISKKALIKCRYRIERVDVGGKTKKNVKEKKDDVSKTKTNKA